MILWALIHEQIQGKFVEHYQRQRLWLHSTTKWRKLLICFWRFWLSWDRLRVETRNIIVRATSVSWPMCMGTWNYSEYNQVHVSSFWAVSCSSNIWITEPLFLSTRFHLSCCWKALISWSCFSVCVCIYTRDHRLALRYCADFGELLKHNNGHRLGQICSCIQFLFF